MLIVISASHCLGVDPEIVAICADVELVNDAGVRVTPVAEQSLAGTPIALLWDGVTVIGFDELTDQEMLKPAEQGEHVPLQAGVLLRFTFIFGDEGVEP